MKRIAVLLIIFAIVLAGIFLFWNNLADFYFKIFVRLPQIEKELGNFFIEKIEKQIATPPPLRAVKEAPESFLTKAGVIELTNVQRENTVCPNSKKTQS